MPPLRVTCESQWPARSLIFSVGAAGWGREGSGAWRSLVYSRSSVEFRLYGGLALCRSAALVWRFRATPTVVLPRLHAGFRGGWRLLGTELAAASPNKKLAEVRGSLLISRSCFELHFHGHHGGGCQVGKKRSKWIWRLGSLFSSVLDGERWRLLMLRSFGFGSGGRWPASLSPPVTLLAERQPNLFLLAMMPTRRQCSVWLVAMASGDGSFVAPSGLVPRRRRGGSWQDAEDLIAFFILCLRSCLQSPRTCLYFLFCYGSGCNMYAFNE